MKPTVLLLAVLGCATASPNGYYHQEYNYKTSASSYKNNELQHQTDDQGYYRKDGDLEGRVKPRIDANSEHSEYVNPNLRTGEYNTGMVGGANGDMSSYGHMRADVGSYGGHDLSSEGLAHTDHIAGSRGGAYQGYTSGSYGSNNYGSSSQSYGMSSNLRSVTSNIQQELERDLQQAVQDNRAYSQSGTSFSELERELRQNLTNRLNAELVNRYGQQSVRGGLSYTIAGGRLHSTANYDNQELQDLRRQLESTLLNQLRTRYYQSGSSSRYESQQSSQGRYDYASTVRPVYYTQYPVGYGSVTTVRPVYTADYTRYTPVSNPQSITHIASGIQNQLDTRLNLLLEDVQRRYFSSGSSYSLTNADVVLENLRNELRNNITYLLNEDVKANYGNQMLRDGYMYSVGSNGQTSNQYNYAVKDLENLRSQIERNLIEKLNRDFETYKSRWYQQSAYSQSSRGSSNIQYSGYSTPRYDTYSTPRYDTYSTPRYDTYSTYTTPRYDIYSTPQYKTYDSDAEHFSTRPASSHIAPLISSGGGSSSSDRHYSLLAGSRQAGYEISGSSNSNIVQLQRQLQNDLSRQLQAALSRSQYGSYSTSGSYNPQSYQVSLQQLSDELNRNLTRQLQEYSASGYYSSYGNFDQSQLASLRSQLQADLMRQLQQGLQQSYQSSSSYSASSSSSSNNANYRPARGFDNYQLGQYRSGGSALTTNGADCVGDNANAYSNSHRMKRSYQPYRSQHIGLSYTGRNNQDSGYYTPSDGYPSNNYRPSYDTNQQQLGQQQVEEDPELGQLVDESDLTQQAQDASFEKLQQGQEVDESDLTQQVEDSGIGRLQLGAESQQVNQNQQTDSSDLTQQVEDERSGKLQLGSLGQQVDDSDLTQQVEDSGFGRLQLGGQSRQVDQNQLADNSDLTQVEDSSRLQLGGQSQRQVDQSQLTDNSDLTQQVEDSGFGRLQLGGQNQQQVDQNQLTDSSDLTQQVDNSQTQQQLGLGLGISQLGSQRQTDLGQQVDNQITQEVEEPGFSKLREPSRGDLGSTQQQIALGQNVDNSDLTQQVEDHDLTQQVENNRLGKLELTSQNQEQDDLDSQQKQDRIQFGQQEDNSDLTQQQVDSDFSAGIQLGSSRNPQNQYGQSGHLQSGGFGRASSQGQWQTTYGTDGNRPTSEYTFSGSNYNQRQRQTVNQIETELFRELKDTVKNYYISNSGSVDYQSTYRDILRDLERNLTRQLQALGPNGSSRYSYTFTFSGPQVESLQKQLESELKVKLQQEISSLAGKNFNPQQTDENYNSQLVQQQQNGFSDQENQQVENPEVPESPSPYASGNLQFGNRPPSDYSSFRSNLNQRQVQTVDHIETELSKQLQEAVKNYQLSYSSSVDYQSTYQDIFRELQRNLTKQLQALGPNSGSNGYSYTVTFSSPQVELLQKQLENDLKVKLQREISNTASTNFNPQQTNQISNSGLYPQSYVTFGNQERQPTEKIVQQSINSDQQNQEATDINGQLPEGSVHNNLPSLTSYPSGNLQLGPSPVPEYFGFNQQKQKETAHQIQTELFKQLRDAVKNYHVSYSGSVDYQSIYQDILKELQRNITNQLQAVGPNSGSNGNSPTAIFSGPQVELLERQLQRDLTFTLQQEISNTAGTNFNPQQTDQISNSGLYTQSYIFPGNQETQPTQKIVQQPIDSDQQNQEVQNLDEQLPESHVDSNQPNSRPYPSGNLQFGNRPTYEYFGSNFDQRQRQTVHQIKTELSNQLKDAVKNYYISYPGSIDYQSTYQNILRELQRNLTSQLQAVGPSSGYTVIFSGPQIELLQQQLENELQLQLQQEISKTSDKTQEIVQQSINTDQQNQQVEDINAQLSNSNQPPQPGYKPYVSGNLQFGNRPLNQRPTDNFLQTEIAQQQNVYPYLDSSNQQSPNNLPTLNQVIEQQQNSQDLPTKRPITLGDDVNQQTQTTYINSQGQYIVVPLQNHQWSNNQHFNGHISTSDQTQDVTNQGQLITQAQYGHTNQGSGSYVYQNQLLLPTQQISTSQKSFQTYLTDGQVQLANELENDLSKQLQDAISQNRFTITYTSSGTINPDTYQINYQQLLTELQGNITKELERQFEGAGESSSYIYGYSTFTPQQKEQLARDLVGDLSRQLQQNLQVYYIQYSGQNPSNPRAIYSSPQTPSFYGSGTGKIHTTSGSSSTTNQLNYGQQEVVPESESADPIRPIEPVLPLVVQNVEPQVSQNLGVKGHGRPRPVIYSPQVSQSENVVPSASAPARDTEVYQPEAELITPLGSGTQEITAQDETQENLPWYKRFHNKVKQGVTSLKDKIIG